MIVSLDDTNGIMINLKLIDRLDDALSVFDPLTSGETEVDETANGAILVGECLGEHVLCHSG